MLLRMVRRRLRCAAILCVPLAALSCSSGSLALATTSGDEIDQDVRAEARETGQAIVQALTSADPIGLQDHLSDELVSSEDFQLSEFVSQVHQLLQDVDLELVYEYHSRLSRSGTVNNATIIPSDRNGPIINQAVFITDESYALFYTSGNPGAQFLLYVYLNKFGDRWQATNIHLGDFLIDNKAAPELFRAMGEFTDAGEIGTALFYGIAASKVLRPVHNLQYRDEQRYRTTFQELIDDFEDRTPFPIELAEDFVMFNLDITSVQEAPLLPTIRFVTDLPLNESSLRALIEQHSESVYSLLPGIESEFDHILFQGYEQLPTDPNEQYNVFGVVIET